MVQVMKAKETDRTEIALCIAEAFQKDFAQLSNNVNTISEAIKKGIHIQRFYVAKENQEIAGVMAVVDCNGRAVSTDKASFRKNFGFIKGTIAAMVLKEEFEGKLDYPETTGYIEFVAVKQNFQRKGIATTLLREAISQGKYNDYVLDVTNVNRKAFQCYQKFGFQEFKRIKVTNPKQKGFQEKIYMQYFVAEGRKES